MSLSTKPNGKTSNGAQTGTDEHASAGSSFVPVDLDEAIAKLKKYAELRALLPTAHARKLWVSAQAERIPKRGQNREQGYQFARESDIVVEIAKYAAIAGLDIAFDYGEQWEAFEFQNDDGYKFALRKHGGLEYIERSTQNGKVQIEVRGEARIILTNVENTDDRIEYWFHGGARDIGDKAIWKFKTGLKKYALSQTFGIATGDDPEGTPNGDDELGFRAGRTNGQAANEQANRDLANAGRNHSDERKAENAADYEARKLRLNQYNEITRLSNVMVGLGLLPADEEPRKEKLRKVLGKLTQNGSNTEEVGKATGDELARFIDLLNGFIADQQKQGAGAAAATTETPAPAESTDRQAADTATDPDPLPI